GKLADHLGELAAALDDALGVGVEQVEEFLLAWHQASEHPGVPRYLWPRPADVSRSTSAALKPQSASAARPPSPRLGAPRRPAARVREKRGAGAGWATPPTSTKLPRAALCGWRLDSENVSTGAKQASEPSNTLHHSVWVFSLNLPWRTSRSSGQ